MICKFEELYQQEAQAQRARYEQLRSGFAKQFGSDDGGEYFSAPGRTEVGGPQSWQGVGSGGESGYRGLRAQNGRWESGAEICRISQSGCGGPERFVS